jgi:hypothetical protein
MAQAKRQQIKNLRCDRDHIGAAVQLAAVGVKSVILEEITLAANPSGGLRSSERQCRLERKE